jgi:hypothetical protein
MKGEESTTDLNRQLEAYDAVAKSPESRARSRWGKWPIYAAATGAALAGASAASADIIYSGPIDISVQGFGYGGVGVVGFYPDRGIVPFGQSHFVGARVSFPVYAFINQTTRSGHVYPANRLLHENAYIFGPGVEFGVQRFFPRTNAITFAKSFALGAPISGPTAASVNRPTARLASRGVFDTSGGHGVIRRTAISGNYVPENPGYAAQGYPWNSGFAGFEIPGPNGPEMGWFQLSFDSDFPGSLAITGWAYNTDGPIDAGQTSATPEPGTLALMLLATGAAGVLAWKRRRARHASQG